LRADIWFSREMLETGNERLLSRARQQGLITSLDINFDPVWPTGKSSEIRRRKRLVRRILPLVDMAHGNVLELCEFTDSPDLKSALGRLAAWGADSVVIHLGKRGAGFFREGKLVTEPADKAKKAIHDTGTGDVLSVCMILLAQNDEFSIQEKLRASNRMVRQFMEGRRSFIPMLK